MLVTANVTPSLILSESALVRPGAREVAADETTTRVRAISHQVASPRRRRQPARRGLARRDRPGTAMSRPRFFYGWVVAVALAVLTSAQVGSSFSFGIFLRPMSEQLGFDRSSLAFAVTLNSILVGALQPFAGYLADRFGPRRIAVSGAIILGCAVLALSYVSTLPQIYLAYGVFGGIGMAMATRGVAARIVGSWFVRRRAIAMALSGGGALIAQIGLVPLATLVLAQSNWQTADRVVAFVILAAIVPITWLLVRNTPREKGLLPDGDVEMPRRSTTFDPIDARRSGLPVDDAPPIVRRQVNGQGAVASQPASRREVRIEPDDLASSAAGRADGLSFREAIHHVAFWQLSFGLISCGVTMSFPYTHLMAYASDLGMPDMTASETIGLAGLLSLPGSLLLAYFGDQFGRHRMLAVAYLLRSLTYLILLQADHPAIMLAAGVTLGLSWGATVSLTAAIVPDVFGHRMIATIVTFMTSLMSVASGAYTYLAGLDYDVLGSYQVALGFAAILAAIAFVCCWRIRMPEAPIRKRAVPVAAG